ncbi:hypothetical protein N1851_012393 [Merluccius polli]|uniref:Uncharacterized protein n=1 Tax=Merluccius polli TaxID=89951 RepID=A0AA47P533_MERPO|nr:hypothetical protein N1851_012393 [Merluccius polli]
MMMLRLMSLLVILCRLWQIPQTQGRIQRKSETTTTEQTWTNQESSALGHSDHCLVHLIPTYKHKLKSAKPAIRTVKKWTTEAKEELQDCFDCTDWSVFEEATGDLDTFTDTVTSYISFCEEVCVPTKTFRTFNNNKPWFTAKLSQLRQAKEEAYRNGDRTLYNALRNTLTKEIRADKRSYSEKLKNRFSANDSAALWRGLQDITNYKRPSPPAEASKGLADDLNDFYCRRYRSLRIKTTRHKNSFFPSAITTLNCS